jgi:hypothetical protein
LLAHRFAQYQARRRLIVRESEQLVAAFAARNEGERAGNGVVVCVFEVVCEAGNRAALPGSEVVAVEATHSTFFAQIGNFLVAESPRMRFI